MGAHLAALEKEGDLALWIKEKTLPSKILPRNPFKVIQRKGSY